VKQIPIEHSTNKEPSKQMAILDSQVTEVIVEEEEEEEIHSLLHDDDTI
jgi:hypothetical protein